MKKGSFILDRLCVSVIPFLPIWWWATIKFRSLGKKKRFPCDDCMREREEEGIKKKFVVKSEKVGVQARERVRWIGLKEGFLFSLFLSFLMSFILSISDPRELSELCATLFQSIWITKRETSFKLFIHKILSSTKISSTTITLALYYIQQLRFVYPTTKGSIGSEVRLFTTALILANKYLEDSPFTNKVILIH